MGFVDGENLVMRYQAMVKGGAKPKADVVHERDCFVWHNDVTSWSMFDFIRVNYYTSTTGDLVKVDSLKDKICSVDYTFNYADGAEAANAMLVPNVFHKPIKNTKARNVDLQISIDFLRAAHLPNVEVLYLLSGDGDYIPLIQEAARYGKEIWVGAFSSGMHTKLKHHIDQFVLLDDLFFE